MITLAHARLAIGTPLVAAVFALMATTPAPRIVLAPVCTLTTADPVPIGPELATATLKFTAAIGDSLSAKFPEESKVEVVSVKRLKTDGPLTATLTLTTIQATAGQWAVSVRGEKGECTGKIWVGQGAAAKKSAPAVAVSAPYTPPTLTLIDLSPVEPPKRAACAAFIEDSIRVGRDRVEVQAKYTEEIGKSLTATFPKESRVEVISATRRAGDEVISVRLTLSTLNAVPGQWKLTLQGDTDSCTGNVYVGAAVKKERQ
jgi:hypothetical protein